MNPVLLIIILVATAAVVGAGIYVTVRAFRAVDRPPVEARPRQPRSNPHDAATTAQLRQFFESKQCATCSRPVAPMHIGEMRPGLLNASTHEAIAWDDIPAAGLSTVLESHVAICSSCLIIETFRKQHPELVVDRHRPAENRWH